MVKVLCVSEGISEKPHFTKKCSGMMRKYVKRNVVFLTQSCFALHHNGTVVYTDPYGLGYTDMKADVILITHPHQDHYSKGDIRQVLQPHTIFVVPGSVTGSFEFKDTHDVRWLDAGESLKLDSGLEVLAIPAYNIKKKFHPKEANWLGYVITVEGKKIYHTGDTEIIPEMKSLDVDIALVPLGQLYTMDSWKDAVKVVEIVNADVGIPMHYYNFEGRVSDVFYFRDELHRRGKCSVVYEKEVQLDEREEFKNTFDKYTRPSRRGDEL